MAGKTVKFKIMMKAACSLCKLSGCQIFKKSPSASALTLLLYAPQYLSPPGEHAPRSNQEPSGTNARHRRKQQESANWPANQQTMQPTCALDPLCSSIQLASETANCLRQVSISYFSRKYSHQFLRRLLRQSSRRRPRGNKEV